MQKIIRKFASAASKAAPIITNPSEFKFTSVSSIESSENSTPKTIYNYLNDHVVGQEKAKRALAIAYSTFLIFLSFLRKSMEKEAIA
jgi:ATP-dependent protease Clp ATPase subunit